MAGPIVLGTDFGPESEAAEQVAIRAAAAAGTNLVIVHAIDVGRLRLRGGGWRERLDQTRSSREHEAAELVAMARRAGVDARVLIWTGDPATCVVDAARAEGAARIVVGSHGRGPIGRVLARSISRAVADLADCPVEIVRPDGPLTSRNDGPDGPPGRAVGPMPTGRSGSTIHIENGPNGPDRRDSGGT